MTSNYVNPAWTNAAAYVNNTFVGGSIVPGSQLLYTIDTVRLLCTIALIFCVFVSLVQPTPYNTAFHW